MGELAEDLAVKKDTESRVKTAILLAGGQSSRIGRDKTLLELGDETLLDRALRRLGQFFPELIVVSNRPNLALSQAKVVKDRIPHLGPLVGILAGLEASSSSLNLVAAVDMPFVQPAILELLVEEAEEDVTCPMLARGPEPLLAVYGKGCLPTIEKHFRRRELKAISFYPEVRVKYVPEERLRKADPDLISFRNINTAEDLRVAREEREHASD